MTSTTKRRIAREWLIFLACLVIGFIIVYLIAWNFRNPDWTPGRVFQEVMKELFTERDAWIGWLFVLAPYFIVLVVRSIIWSVNTLRRY